MKKVDAAAETLNEINPDVCIESYHINVTSMEGFKTFSLSLSGKGKAGEQDKSQVIYRVNIEFL